MAVTRTQASLCIYGRTADATAARVTRELGIEPDRRHETGDGVPSRHSPGRLRKSSAWIVDEAMTEADEGDFHGMASLDRLAARFAPLAPILRALTADYHVVVSLCCDSDSSQGGLAISGETMQRLGAIGAEFLPTVYFDGDE